MKNIILAFLTLTAVTPLTLLADAPATLSTRAGHKTVTVSRAPKVAQKNIEYVFITSRTATGSHLPLVVRSYNGVIEDFAPNALYGRGDLDQTGQLNVGAQLVNIDPAITFTHR